MKIKLFMKNFLLTLLSFGLFFSCKSREEKKEFTPEILAQSVQDASGQEITFGDVLEQHKGKKTIIEVWASWCPDCIKSLPKVAEYQKNNPDVDFIFVSVDNDASAWANGVEKHMNQYELKGSQILMPGGWGKGKGSAFTEYIELDWIPRYMLLDENGNIEVYYAKDISDLK